MKNFVNGVILKFHNYQKEFNESLLQTIISKSLQTDGYTLQLQN